MDEHTNIFNLEPTVDDAAAALLKGMQDDEGEPLSDEDQIEESDEDVTEEEPEEEPEGDEDEGSEDEEDDGSEEESDDTGEDKTAQKRLAEDDDEVVFSVDGKEERVSVKDLRRLAGQEKALTQKSQQLADERKIAERKGLLAFATLERQIKKAQERVEKYKDVDLNLAAARLEPEEYKALKDEVEAAKADVNFFESEAANLLKAYDDGRKANLQLAAKAARSEITNPNSRFHIADWNDQVYNEILTYGVTQGLDADVLKEMTDPASLKLIHKAMLADRSQETKKTVKAKVKTKVAKAPKRALSKSDTPSSANERTLKKLREAATETGSIDDVARFMLARG